MEEVTLLSPAKINFFLEVLGKREDGYHEVRTALALIDLCDEVHLQRRTSGLEVKCSDPRAPQGPANLAYQAAELFFHARGLGGIGLTIFIQKRIPVAGGLGGGSSNAAATLWGLNQLFDLRLSREELQKLGARLGSDVPFFLTEGVALAEGRGELLTPLPPLPPLWVVLVNPGLEVSTAWAFSKLKMGLTSPDPDINIIDLMCRGGFPAILARAANSLEAPVFECYPILGELKQRFLSWGARPALMTGSGPTVFGAFPDEGIARACRDYFSMGGYFTALCRTLDHNPIFKGWKGG